MPTTARKAQGITVSYGDAVLSATPTYTALTGVISATLPTGYSVNALDKTSHGSTAREYLAGMADYGTINIEWFFDYDDTDHTAIQAASFGQTQRAWQIELPLIESTNTSKATYTFDGFIEDISDPTAGVDDLLRCTITVRVSDQPTFAAEAL